MQNSITGKFAARVAGQWDPKALQEYIAEQPPASPAHILCGNSSSLFIHFLVSSFVFSAIGSGRILSEVFVVDIL